MLVPNQRQRRSQERIARQLGEIGFALPGSLVRRMTACGKAGCRCGADSPVLHGPYLSWTRAVGGKTITRKIPEDQQERYQEWLANARRLRRLVNELEELSVQAIEQTRGFG